MEEEVTVAVAASCRCLSPAGIITGIITVPTLTGFYTFRLFHTWLIYHRMILYMYMVVIIIITPSPAE
jgi:hypothetical protein